MPFPCGKTRRRDVSSFRFQERRCFLATQYCTPMLLAMPLAIDLPRYLFPKHWNNRSRKWSSYSSTYTTTSFNFLSTTLQILTKSRENLLQLPIIHVFSKVFDIDIGEFHCPGSIFCLTLSSRFKVTHKPMK